MMLSKKMRSALIFGVLHLMITMGIQASVECCAKQEECDNLSKNLWQPRPFSSYHSGELVMLQDLALQDDWSIVFGAVTEYMKGFGDSRARLGALPFWSGTNTMTIGNNDGESDLDAYQFGLGDVKTQGSITLTPRVEHIGSNFIWHLFQNPVHETGFYAQLKAPLGAMMIETQVCETEALLVDEVDKKFERYTPLQERFRSITEALRGGVSATEPDYEYGRLCAGRQTAIRCGDLEASVGYNIFANEDGYFGLGFKVSCPTGNVPEAKFIMEPVFGRAGHWGVGGEMRGSYMLWEDDNKQLFLSGKAEAMHLFSGRRPNWRSFDLKQNGPGSKYMLLQQYLPVDDVEGTPITIGSVDTQTSPLICTSSYVPSHLIPAINITTLPVFSKFGVEGSASLMLTGVCDNWSMSLGAEFWGRSKECLRIDCDQALKQGEHRLNDFAVLGRQIDRDRRFTVDGVSLESTSQNSLENAELFLCEPLARINKSEDRVCATGNPPGGPTAVSPNLLNLPSGPLRPYPTGTTTLPVDSGGDPNTQAGDPLPAGTEFYDGTKIKDARLSANRIPSRFDDALDVAGAAARKVFTGRITADVGYTWKEHAHEPHLSFLAGAEFSGSSTKHINLWSVGVQGSLKF